MFINGKTDPQTIVRLQEQLKIHNHLYKELLRSKPYRLARLGELFLHAFTQAQSRRKFLRMAQDLWRGYRSRQKYPLLSVCPDNPAKGAYFSNENFIVYTAIFGAYDLPQEPLFVPDNCSFYIFTDQPVAENSVWKKCPTDFLGPQFAQLSNPYKNRFCKMFPHKLFPQAKHSIYLDGNIMPITDLTEFITLLSAYGLLTHAHKSRRCVYDEINACKYVKKGDPAAMDAYAAYLKKAGFPEKYGMLECNMLVRNHTCQEMQQLMEQWWNEFLSSETKRDQLSLPFVLWKNHIRVEQITRLGGNIERNDALRIVQHN